MAQIFNIYHPAKGYLAYYRSPSYLGWTPCVRQVFDHDGVMSRHFSNMEKRLVECMNDDIDTFRDAKIVYRMHRDEEPEIDHRFQPYDLVKQLIVERDITTKCSEEFRFINAITDLGNKEFETFLNSFEPGELLVRIPIPIEIIRPILRHSTANGASSAYSYNESSQRVEDYARQFIADMVNYEQHLNLFKVTPKDQMIFKLSINTEYDSFLIQHKMNIARKNRA